MAQYDYSDDEGAGSPTPQNSKLPRTPSLKACNDAFDAEQAARSLSRSIKVAKPLEESESEVEVQKIAIDSGADSIEEGEYLAKYIAHEFTDVPSQPRRTSRTTYYLFRRRRSRRRKDRNTSLDRLQHGVLHLLPVLPSPNRNHFPPLSRIESIKIVRNRPTRKQRHRPSRDGKKSSPDRLGPLLRQLRQPRRSFASSRVRCSHSGDGLR